MLYQSICAVSALLLWVSLALGQSTPATEPPDFGKLKEESIKKWSGAEVLLTGKLTKVTAGPVGLSQPPTYSYRLQIMPGEILRGQAKAGQQLTAGYSIRQENEPQFPPADKECLIALRYVRDAWVLQSIEVTTKENIPQAKLATAFPLGWTVKSGKLISPWANVGKPVRVEGAVCSVTGRPVLLAGSTIRFTVEPVPPAKKLKYGNPDGDGEYKLLVKNDGKEEVKVPALLTDGKTIRWNESVIIRCQDQTYPIPGSRGNLTGLKPVVLKAGESVSGTTHVFALDGPKWPMGGYRIEFQFCLGEKSATHSFYYLSKHHDPIREAVQKGLKK